MVTLDDVAAMAMAMPEVTEGDRHGGRTWAVAGKVFAWERTFSKADIRRYGDVAPPTGDIVAVRVSDLADKEAVLAEESPGFFTIPHFDGYAAVLIQLGVAHAADVRGAIEDGWLAMAPSRLTAHFADPERPSV